MPDSSLDENIDSVLAVRKREREQRSAGQRLVERISLIIGRPLYLVALFVFIAGWITYNLMAPHWDRTPFDPLAFSILDGIVSLAALISTTVVLTAQIA
jgi:uncharacterized membrane protein